MCAMPEATREGRGGAGEKGRAKLNQISAASLGGKRRPEFGFSHTS